MGAGTAFFILILAMPAGLWAAPGSTTGNILKLSLSPRAVGMGEAFSAVGGGVDSLSINPAGLAAMRTHEFKAMHSKLALGLRQDEIAYGLPTRWGSFAAEFMSFGSGAIDAYDASDQRQGTVKVSDQLFRLGYAKRIRGTFSAGISLAHLQENLAGVKAGTQLADLGARAQMLDERLSLGLAYRNLGPGLKFDAVSDPIPQTVVAGVAWEQEFKPFMGLLLGIDMLKPNDRSVQFHAGAELRLYDMLSLRGGYLSEQDIGSGIRMGVGLRWRNFGADYALATLGDLGDTHRMAVSVRFNAPGSKQWAPSSPPAAVVPAAPLRDSVASDIAADSSLCSAQTVVVWNKKFQGASQALTGRLQRIRTGPEGIEIELSSPGGYRVMCFTAPLRLVVDFLNTIDSSGQRYHRMDNPSVTQVRSDQYRKEPVPIARFVLDLKRPIFYSTSWDGNTFRVRWKDASGGRR